MNDQFSKEKREFTRIDAEIPVQYSFMCDYRDEPELDKTYEGKTEDISGGGLLLKGKIPELSWVPELLTNKMKVAVKLQLQEEDKSDINALTRVAWIETIDEFTLESQMGLSFTEITNEDQDQIFNLVIQKKAPQDSE